MSDNEHVIFEGGITSAGLSAPTTNDSRPMTVTRPPFTPEQEARIREIVVEVISEAFKHAVTVNPAYRGNPSEDND